jgi:hypothetical protein
MAGQSDDLTQIKRATAILVTCAVQTLGESNRTAQARFVKRLDEAYATLRDDRNLGGQHVLEMMAWVRTLVTGWNLSTGQGEPFLENWSRNRAREKKARKPTVRTKRSRG